jgi:hypothetical protein
VKGAVKGAVKTPGYARKWLVQQPYPILEADNHVLWAVNRGSTRR